MSLRHVLSLVPVVLIALAAAVHAVAPEPLTVMSFNIRYGTANDGPDRWELRRDQLFALIKNQNPDVIGLQEALHFQIEEILAALPEYRMVGVGRSDGGQGGEYAAILYRASRLSARAEQHLLVFRYARGREVEYLGRGARADLHVGAVRRQAGHTVLRLQPPPRSRVTTRKGEERRSSAESDRGTLTGVAGDRDRRLQHRRKQSRDASGGESASRYVPRRSSNGDGSWHHNQFKLGTTTGDKIDYIFVEPATEVISADIVRTSVAGRYPSDHFPVVARIRLR